MLAWYLVLAIVGWCCLPLVWGLCRRLPDRGLFVLRPLGLLLTGYVSWLCSAAGVLQNDRTGALIALGLVGGSSLLWGRRALRDTASAAVGLRQWLRQHRNLVLVSEILFLVVFVGWCWVRAHDPAIDHTEEPMDLLFLSAVMTSPAHPPRDPWLSGFAISYYYFGYWLQGTLGLLAARLPEVAYNLAQATWLAMVSSGSFGVVYNLLKMDRRAFSPASEMGASGQGGGAQALAGERWRPILGGLLGAFVVAGASNIDATLRGLSRWLWSSGVSDSWWWWWSSRVVKDIGPDGGEIELITEFPAFSFVLGDNHPHVLSLPLLLIVIALALNLFASQASAPAGSGPASGARGAARRLVCLVERSSSCPPWLTWGILLIAAAVPLAVNTWDLPLSWLLLVGAVVAATRQRREGVPGRMWPRRIAALCDSLGPGIVFALALAIATPILFLPHVVSAQSQQRGLLPNLFHPTDIKQFLLVFGGFLPLLIGLLAQVRQGVGRKVLLRVVGLACVGAVGVLLLGGVWVALSTEGSQWADSYAEGDLARVVLGRWLRQPYTLVLILVLVSAAVARIAPAGAGQERDEISRRSSEPPGHGFALGLAAAGLLMLLIPELFYVRDVFVSRMNTVFKFYYQAWLLLGLAVAYAMVRAGEKTVARKLLTGGGLVLLLASVTYPIQAAATKMSWSARRLTLDGLVHLRPDEREAIRWIRRNTPADAIILQAPGDSYRADQCRLSAATGRATLLGWQGHEQQWRGVTYGALTQGRLDAATTIYRDGDGAAIRKQIERYSIDYIYIGPEERRRYGLTGEREAALSRLSEQAFESGESRILRTKRGPA
jgi:YYY domain-containing protein